MTVRTKRWVSVLLCLLLAWSALVTVDFFRLNNHEDTKQPLIYISGTDYAYDYAIYGGLGYSVRYDFDGTPQRNIEGVEFRVLGLKLYDWAIE